MRQVWGRLAPHGELPASDLVEKFNLNSEEDFVKGVESRSELLRRLTDQFDQNQDGRISESEFVDFYTNVSPSFENDETFCSAVRAHWGLY